jgi:4'-phosphopantetheinyl transferase
MTPHLTSWPSPPVPLLLKRDEVHIWRAALDQPASVVKSFSRILAPDERDTAERFRFQKDREHFIVARGLLRTILGRYLNLEPARLRFCYNAYGKPTLDETFAAHELRFNLSHSHGLVLYAFARQREIGLDIEYLREDLAAVEIARQFFSPREAALFSALPQHLRVEGFFNCWTRKEAYIKAKGLGLSLSLDSFEVSLVPGERAALLSVADVMEKVERWAMMELAPGQGYVAALVVEGHDWKLKLWQWETGMKSGLC